jgi:hypothetical protein
MAGPELVKSQGIEAFQALYFRTVLQERRHVMETNGFLRAAVLFCGMAFFYAVGGMAQDPPKPAENPTPWGEPVDGMACRLTMKPEYCLGEVVSATVELKNASEKERTILPIFDFKDKRRAELEITGPDGERLRMLGGCGYSAEFGPTAFTPLAAGGIEGYEIEELRKLFKLETAGTYTVTYTYHGAKPSKVVSGRAANGQDIFDTPMDEDIAKAWDGTVKSNTATFKVVAPSEEDLGVHEWGVFTIYNDAKYANAGRKAEWATLPEGFYRQFPTQRLHWVPAAWDKPIIYFHTGRESVKVEVEVSFTDGAPVVWWPAANSPTDDSSGKRPREAKAGPLFRKLCWTVWLGKKVPGLTEGPNARGGMVDVEETELPDKCWLKEARAVKEAALVTAIGTDPDPSKAFPWTAARLETERFIYYDGLMPAPDFLRCVEASPDGANVTLKNSAGFALQDLFIVDRRGGNSGPVRFAHVEKVEPGAEVKVDLNEVAAKDWPGAGETALSAALEKTGLLKSEVQAMVSIWRQGFFLSEGLTGFYLLPQAEYDRMLPLSVKPKPARVLRVGIARHSHLEGEPAISKRAAELIAELDSDSGDTRDAATNALAEMGPVAFRLVREALEKTDSPEVKKRCTQILDSCDASDYIEKAETGPGKDQKHPGR